MIARCARCQYVFTTDRYGKQYCPSCGAELVVPAPEGAQPPASEPLPPGGPSIPVSGPSAARCATHPDRPASGTCSRCGAFACAECLQPLPSGELQCAHCRERTGELQPTPWEERDTHGAFVAYVETLKRSFKDPTRFFESMRVDNPNGTLSFYWITTVLSVVLGQIWQILFRAVGFSGFGAPAKLPAEHPLAAFTNAASSPWSIVGVVIVMSIFAPLGLYLSAGILHLSLMLFKSTQNGFNATLRSVAYASGPNLLQAIPVCGGYLGAIWSLVLVVIGLWKTQRTTPGAAIGAVVVPIVVFGCCLCGLGILAATAGGLALSRATGQ